MNKYTHEQIVSTKEEQAYPVSAEVLSEPLYRGEGESDMKASLREATQVLRRRKWTILLTTLAVVGLASAYVALSSPEYEAYTLLMVEEPPSSQAGEQDPLRSGRLVALDRRQNNLTDQSLLLRQSLPIAEATLRRLRRARSQIDGPVTALGTEGQSDTSRTALAERLQGNYISAGREDSQEGNALRVTATSTNPQEAAFIANAYAAEYIDHAQQQSRRRIASARSFLERQRSQKEEELRRLETQIQQYKSQTGATALETEIRRRVEQRSELEARLDEARVERQRAQAALESVQGELEEIRPRLAERVSSGADEEIGQAQARIAELESRLEQIYVKNPELRENPSQNEDVAELNNEVNQLRDRVRRLTEQYVGEMMAVGGTEPFKAGGGASTTYVTQLKRKAAEERVALSGATAKISALQQRLAASEQRLQNIPEQSMQLARLRREQLTAEKVYTTLSEQLQEVRLADEATIAPAEVVRPALVPGSPLLPHTLILAVGLLLGLSLGGLAAVVRHKTDTRLYTPEDLRTRNLRTAGVVPDWYLAADNRRRLAAGNGRDAEGDGRLPETASLASRQPGGAVAAESYRRLYMNVLSSGGSEKRPVQTVLVTSPAPGAGKSTTALNLAVAAARAGQRTLLVDADLRKPQIRELLGTDNSPFLTDLLEDPEVAMRETERLATPVDHLYAVTLREPLDDADVVLSSPSMERLIEQLRVNFDLIVFDTPPVLAVADATFLASRCDATVVVAQAGKTEAEELEQVTEELREAQAKVVGTVLNRFNPSEPSSYTSRYRYEYGYSADGSLGRKV